MRILIALIRGYQCMVRPFLIGSCKFHPTCSEYAIEALQTHGLLRGSGLAFTRVLRCHPFSPGRIDPVPPVSKEPGFDFRR
jgi:putative membrane protein insertion efficiency factor